VKILTQEQKTQYKTIDIDQSVIGSAIYEIPQEEVTRFFQTLQNRYDVLMRINSTLDVDSQIDTNNFSIFKDLVEVIENNEHTSGHSKRVSFYCSLFGEYINLSWRTTAILSTGAAVHDLGKAMLPKKILQKPGALSKKEATLMRKHPLMGVKLLQSKGYYPDLLPSVLYHHEKYDGTGYPFGLRGKQIPFHARVISIADAYDAMTSDRPYRRRLENDEALYNLFMSKGTQFDPDIVNSFINAINNMSALISPTELRSDYVLGY